MQPNKPWKLERTRIWKMRLLKAMRRAPSLVRKVLIRRMMCPSLSYVIGSQTPLEPHALAFQLEFRRVGLLPLDLGPSRRRRLKTKNLP